MEADVQHGLVADVGDRLAHPERRPVPARSVDLLPRHRRAPALAGDVLPAGLGPQRAVVVAAGVDEAGVLGVGHRGGVEPEVVDPHGVGGLLVVQRERLVGRCPSGTRAPGWNTSVPASPGTTGGRRRVGVQHRARRRAAGGWPASSPRAAARAGRSSRTRSPPARVAALVERRRPRGGRGPARAPGRRTPAPRRGSSSGSCGPPGARVGERVVELVEVLADALGALLGVRGAAAHQPEVLHVRDVREVPVERRHQRRVLAGEVGVVHGEDVVGQGARPGPRRLEVGGAGVGAARGRPGGRRPGS